MMTPMMMARRQEEEESTSSSRANNISKSNFRRLTRIHRLKKRYGSINNNSTSTKKRVRGGKREEAPLIARWDSMPRTTSSINNSSSASYTGMSSSSSSQVSQSQAQQPPRQPRSSSERLKSASLRSGIDLNSIALTPVHFVEKNNTKKKRRSNKQDVVMVAVTNCDGEQQQQPLSSLLPLQQDHQTPPLHQEQQHTNFDFTVVFCVRRAGCGDCRDNGQRLSALKSEFGKQMNLFGILKGVETKQQSRVTKFYTDYFQFPLFVDHNNTTFKFLGNRKLSMWKLLSNVPKMETHYKRNGIENRPFGGDMFTQGGVLLFNKTGQLKYVYYEQYGKGLDLEVLRSAINCIQQEQQEQQQSSSFNVVTDDNNNKHPATTTTTAPPRKPVRDMSESEDYTEDNIDEGNSASPTMQRIPHTLPGALVVVPNSSTIPNTTAKSTTTPETTSSSSSSSSQVPTSRRTVHMVAAPPRKPIRNNSGDNLVVLRRREQPSIPSQ